MEWSWWYQWNYTSMNAEKWVNNVNNISAYDVQDNGEGYNKVLIQLSAEDKTQISGWSRTLLFLKYCDTTNTWMYKYSKIFRNSNLNAMNKPTKIWNMKHKINRKKRCKMQKEKAIKCI